ncbi:MAG: M24 family metallopeptidase [Rectinemataceae bacterium]
MKFEKLEYETRLAKLRESMRAEKADLFMVYGDEYRRESLRYLADYWPIFERGLLLVAPEGEPVLLVSPESEHVAMAESVWQDIRLVRDLGMSYVPEEVEFTNVAFTTIPAVMRELVGSGSKRVMISGLDAMCKKLYDRLASYVGEGSTVIDGDPALYGLRRIKSPAEVLMLKKTWAICDLGYKALLDSDIVGLTELQAVAIAEKAARDAGAEAIVFSLFSSGEERTNTVVGRATEKIIRKGEMIMFAFASQYGGYIASDEWPFVAGGSPTPAQDEFIYHLVKAEDLGVRMIGNRVLQGDVVKMIRDYFTKNDMERYDLYPPMHGNGLAEAESPYPDEKTREPFVPGIGINFDVSLFGCPGIGSNRIEEGFVIEEKGILALSPLISGLREQYLTKRG